jgi:hypothetical protein
MTSATMPAEIVAMVMIVVMIEADQTSATPK